ncbi:hypothetical protein TUM4630_20710 [Shewanella algidipiscicola]|uniref:Uncharacterized protein n=1 Tax=Shewanella algidipiscicola TaxID=614070 RepID=A0ABQ4PIK6_9GAMM|nr:hypothetical protein TUM4630_20710 [Shewanella algidipiscicola]
MPNTSRKESWISHLNKVAYPLKHLEVVPTPDVAPPLCRPQLSDKEAEAYTSTYYFFAQDEPI